ncbi:WxL domain-containing protein [Cryobacterium sp. Y11]|uniref:WxL domain-containing protein n=1 Tax=Cryobacterium sp. Y11 TaxID=2045016 RepID=UPI0011B01C3D|nr:WxL domain-containing protein [Cryobacterium sp. Y11]
MRIRTTMVRTLIVTGLLVGTSLVGATVYRGEPASADSTDTVQFTVMSGGLQSTVSAPRGMSRVVLGSGEQRSTGTAAPWTISDARGSGASWTLSASASDFTSAPGTSADELVPRTIAVTNLVITPGTVVAAGGADTAPDTAAVTMSTLAQALVSAPVSGTGAKGSFVLAAPLFSLDIPANAFRSNVGVDGVHPYTSTIVFTIA